MLESLYPKATVNRFSGRDKKVQAPRRAFLKAAFINFTILQILFLGLFVYIFGSLFQQSRHIHNMNVLYVDYDGGVIGSSVRDAYQSLKADSFPTLQEESPTKFQTPGDIEKAVCKTRYWGAIYTLPGASSRLANALSGGTAATTYNNKDVMTYVWNEARYSAIIDTTISANLKTLSGAARIAYVAGNGTSAMELLSPSNSNYDTSISIFANPWQLTDINLQPTTQGSRLIYNTLVIILILIQEFFYLGTINSLYVQFKIYARLYPHRIIIYRNMISLSYTLVGALCTTGAIWAFRVDWDVNGNQFVLSWMVLWLFAHANFLSLDVFTVWLPVQYVPMSLITWVVFNVTSILIPFELSPAFYKWAYVMPAHEVYQVLIDIWSRGCNPQLRYALPILFALEISGLFLSALGVYRRCHYAHIAELSQERAFQERVDVAMKFERERDQERAAQREEEKRTRKDDIDPETEVDEEAMQKVRTEEREKMAGVIRGEDQQLRRESTRLGRAVDFGPAFGMAFQESREER